MKRLLAVWLCILMLPFSAALAEAEEPDRTETGVPDPNWVLWEEPDDAVEAFAADGAPVALFGMQPLSRYAQVYSVTDEDLILAARVAYLEAGGTNERAYRAVLCVLYNRCMATRFGGEITDIQTEAFRKGQFSVIHNKRFSTFEPPEEILDAARDIFVSGNLDLPENILFFCAERIGKGFGGHKFYQNIGGNLFFYGKVD